MNDDIRKISQEILAEIAKGKELTSNTSIHDIFLSAENLISSLAYLIGPIAEMEQKYRKEALQKEGESVAGAEARAKATDIYKDWRKLVNLYELSHEAVMVLKKFRDDLQKEYQRA